MRGCHPGKKKYERKRETLRDKGTAHKVFPTLKASNRRESTKSLLLLYYIICPRKHAQLTAHTYKHTPQLLRRIAIPVNRVLYMQTKSARVTNRLGRDSHSHCTSSHKTPICENASAIISHSNRWARAFFDVVFLYLLGDKMCAFAVRVRLFDQFIVGRQCGRHSVTYIYIYMHERWWNTIGLTQFRVTQRNRQNSTHFSALCWVTLDVNLVSRKFGCVGDYRAGKSGNWMQVLGNVRRNKESVFLCVWADDDWPSAVQPKQCLQLWSRVEWGSW